MTNPMTFKHVQRLVERQSVALSEGGRVHTTPTVFFGRIPDRLLMERQARLNNGQSVREWYLITEEPTSEWTEELIGDFGVLVVEVANLGDARRDLREMANRLLEPYWDSWRSQARGVEVHGPILAPVGGGPIEETDFA